MIFPDEYKQVGVTKALPAGSEELIYFLTEYLIEEGRIQKQAFLSMQFTMLKKAETGFSERLKPLS
jgi:mannitol/fructose-specific phosphotransferase system IIA component (Ntr-type)